MKNKRTTKRDKMKQKSRKKESYFLKTEGKAKEVKKERWNNDSRCEILHVGLRYNTLVAYAAHQN